MILKDVRSQFSYDLTRDYSLHIQRLYLIRSTRGHEQLHRSCLQKIGIRMCIIINGYIVVILIPLIIVGGQPESRMLTFTCQMMMLYATFRMTYDIKIIFQVKISLSIPRVEIFEPGGSEKGVCLDNDLLEEVRNEAHA